MNKKYQLGIALVQVLIISIVLSILGIYISNTVQSQIQTSGLIKQSHQHILKLQSAEAELLHHLITTEKRLLSSHENNYLSWNFYGKDFEITQGIIANIQDITGLLSLNHTNKTLTKALLTKLDKSDEQIREFIDSLSDWKDLDDLKHINGAESSYYSKLSYSPRNSYLQSFSEISLIKRGEILSKAQWEKFFSLSLVSSFNPLNAPDELLEAFISDSRIVDEVKLSRSNGKLNGLVFFQITGIEEDDFISFRTGRIFKVKLRSSDNINTSKSFIVELHTSSTKRPVTITDVTWNIT